MRNQLSDFCITEDNALDVRVCDELIEIFRNNTHLHERYDNAARPNFTQLNYTKHFRIGVVHDYLVYAGMQVVKKYRDVVPETFYWPKQFSFEEFRIKHYTSNGIDQFDMHVDSISNETAKRFLVFFWYLNDVEEGGTTEFPQLQMVVKPVKARCFMFPPMWLFPHKGSLVTKGEKFLLSSYLHYSE